jgi:hypothetical protein
MRKNFTQLFLGLALILGFAAAGNAQCDIDPPAGAFYNFQFDGGAEGWRSLDAAGFEDPLLWQWSETGDLKMGFYSSMYPDVIDSESQCNGAMVMDSDNLDNAGLGPDGFGTGHCPADCNGYLVSPVMDLSGSEAIELLFTQSVRQFQSSYFIYVSVDGGASNVDTIEINDDLVTNAAVSSKNFRLPLCAAGGQAEVVLTFHFEANYYVWAIDDVSLIEASKDVDMRVNSNFYAKVGNYITPVNMGIPHVPLVDIENLKAFDNPGSTVHFRLKDSDGTEIFSSSREYGIVPGCSTDENKLFDDIFEMPTAIGDYTLEYEIVAPGDIDLSNNLLTAPFKISNSSFRKLPTQEEFGSEYLSGVRYGGTYVSWGSYFRIPQNEEDQAIESVSLGIITNAGVEPSPGIVTVSVYQWDDVEDIGDVNTGERTLLGEAIQFIEPGSPEFQQWDVIPLDEDGNLIVPAPGADLLVIGHSAPFDGNTNYFFNAVQETGFEVYSQAATNLAHRQLGLPGGYASFASGDSPSDDDRDDRELFNIDGAYVFDIAMELTPIIVGTEDINEALAIKVSPTLATNLVNVDLNLENLSEKVTIEVMDFSGNLLRKNSYSNIQNDRLTIDVTEFASGMYLVNIRTEDGMTSRKITVVR